MIRRLLVAGMICAAGMASAQVDFTSSNLPIIVINTHGQQVMDEPKIPADMGIIYNGPGQRNNMTDSSNNFKGKIGIEFHGSSSQQFPKKSYGIQVWDDQGNSVDASLLGMPAKDDWVLLAPYDDKSLIRDALAYKLGRDQGRYASRSRYCEVVIDGYYMGVFVLLEKIKRDKYRVDIAKLTPTDIDGMDLTGGYIIKIDKTTGSGGGLGWTSNFRPNNSTANQTIYFQFEYPKPEDIATSQESYIASAVNAFETALASDNFEDPQKGYAKYIDVPSVIDFLIMNEITKNPDGYRLSTFFYKQRDSDGGKLFLGPIWDFNEGFGNVNYCTQGNPEGLVLDFNSICPTDYWQIPFWWDRLFEDRLFQVQLSERWSSLRKGPFQTERILNYVDSVAAVLNVEAQQRNFQAWPVLGQYVWPNYYVGTTFQDEVNWLKNWIIDRVAWLDNRLAIVTGFADSPQVFSVSAYPNPFTQEITFEYSVNAAGDVRIEIDDILGRTLQVIDQSCSAAGTYRSELRLQTPSSGVFLFRARLNDRPWVTQRLVKASN